MPHPLPTITVPRLSTCSTRPLFLQQPSQPHGHSVSATMELRPKRLVASYVLDWLVIMLVFHPKHHPLEPSRSRVFRRFGLGQFTC